MQPVLRAIHRRKADQILARRCPIVDRSRHRPGEYRHQPPGRTGHRPAGLQTRGRQRGLRASSDFGSVKLRATTRPDRVLHGQSVADAVQHPEKSRQKQQAWDCDEHGCGECVSGPRRWRVLRPGAPHRGCQGLTSRPRLATQIRRVPILDRSRAAHDLGYGEHIHADPTFFRPRSCVMAADRFCSAVSTACVNLPRLCQSARGSGHAGMIGWDDALDPFGRKRPLCALLP